MTSSASSSSTSASSGTLSDLLKNLPTHNSENFSKVAAGGSAYDISSAQRQHYNSSTGVSSRYRNPLYVPTKDFPGEQRIVTEKTNILLRYLHQQWDKKAAQQQQLHRKREASATTEAGDAGDQRKKARLEARMDSTGNRAASSSSSSAANGAARRDPRNGGDVGEGNGIGAASQGRQR